MKAMREIVKEKFNSLSGSSAGFTLLELLLVVSLISILLGIVVPTYHGVREHAKRTHARTAVKHLETAFREYYNYYRLWPGADGEVSGNLYRALQGDNDDGLVFFEFEKIKGAPNPDTAYDPWEQPYRVKFDNNFNNQINHAGETIYRSVIVWSKGPDKTSETDEDICSWK